MKIIRKNKKDKERREIYKQAEKMKNMYKMLRRNELLDQETRNYFNMKVTSSEKNSSISRIKNRCVETGRSRGIISAYRISRLRFREYMKMGLISGVKKISY
ncbi:ribosomal protein S14 (mitochondrion) [Dictyostelium discoideum]|uniref:Small ribosomal subunit protein uS14m n=1 Tax=Dictyostelium discoideum TaxID=44689 RepID=RT14_DICDI|nr:ribosomal protein S14 [Dictyostelium discoideum]O21035.1 RecName: Full=Small ribosomal subunit protein uS14m; AltName: Full=Ribosomal protein S14, mitochondrial; Short=MRP-S14; Short=S14mt [Dictyostelium discoideum]BAA23572.1 ribosomal protein S14 [Dictyostelium discoideum]BAA78080.1 ribosomal protein S14 [Dictyostelium discoideum]|eukprot:NP_050098.1 ribosomal protein S14 (mitochondrion) [Dictyostelium discoideum]